MVVLYWAHTRASVLMSVGSGQSTMGTPSRSGIMNVSVNPKEWNRGRSAVITSVRRSLMMWSPCCAFEMIFLCVSSTPFGEPSEPELKRMTASSESLAEVNQSLRRMGLGVAMTMNVEKIRSNVVIFASSSSR